MIRSQKQNKSKKDLNLSAWSTQTGGPCEQCSKGDLMNIAWGKASKA